MSFSMSEELLNQKGQYSQYGSVAMKSGSSHELVVSIPFSSLREPLTNKIWR